MKAFLPEPDVVTRKGNAVSVIISMKDYQFLLERLENAEDLAWLNRFPGRKTHFRPIEDYLVQHNK